MVNSKSTVRSRRTRVPRNVIRSKQTVPSELNQYITTKKAAELLGVDRTQAARLVRDGKITGIKLGHDWLVFTPSLEDYHRTKSPGGRPPSKTPRLG